MLTRPAAVASPLGFNCREIFPAQVLYQEIADRACDRIKAAITKPIVGDRPIKAILDTYNPIEAI